MVTWSDLLLVVVLALSAAVGGRAYRNRPNRGATTLAAFMLTVVVWQGGHLAAHFAGGPLDVALERLQWLGAGAAAFVWLLFVLEYVGRESLVTRRTAAAALAWPAVLNALVWASVVVDLPWAWPALRDGEGALFWTHVVLSYAVFAAGSVLLVRFLWRRPPAFRSQALAVVVGIATLWVGTLVQVLELFGGVHVHGAVVGLTCTGVAFLWATTRGRLTDLVPVATSTVLRTMDAGVVVVDRDGRVVEVNPVAVDLLGVDAPGDVVGEPLEAAVDDPALADALASLSGDGATTVSLEGRELQVRASPLGERSGGGRVYLLGDITEQKARERRLRRQNERLDAFAGVVSHDLRNPLTVAQGRVDEAIDTGDVDHLEAVQDAHDRIDQLVGDLLALAREGEDVEDPRPLELAAAARDAWATVETPGATLEVERDRRLLADPGQLERLLENLFRNAVEHGSTSPQQAGDAVEHGSTSRRPEADGAVEHGRGEPAGAADGGEEEAGDDESAGDAPLTVTVGATGEGFYVADDGVGIPEDDRDQVLASGFSTGADGAGLGLAIVESVADAHGWTVAVGESDAGGARFDFAGVATPEADGPFGGPA